MKQQVTIPAGQTWLNSAQACSYLSIGRLTLKHLRDTGKINFYEYKKNDNAPGRSIIWYKMDDLDRFVRKHDILRKRTVR